MYLHRRPHIDLTRYVKLIKSNFVEHFLSIRILNRKQGLDVQRLTEVLLPLVDTLKKLQTVNFNSMNCKK